MVQTIVEIDHAELSNLKHDGLSAIENAKKIAHEIKDADTLGLAGKMMLECKARAKAIIERLKKPKANARQDWQNWVDLETELCEPYKRIENDILKPAMAQFTQEQERKRRIEEDRLRAEARKREEDARLQEAAQLEKAGKRELADAVIAAPVIIAPIVLPRVEQPKGISYRTAWRFRIVDQSKIPREYLCVDEQKIGGVVRSLKDATAIPGVEVFSEQVVAGRI